MSHPRNSTPAKNADHSEPDSSEDVLAAAIHDCNNFLMGIYGNSDFLVQELGSEHPYVEVAEEIRNAAEDAMEAISRIKNLK